jgi:hypothetical protein
MLNLKGGMAPCCVPRDCGAMKSGRRVVALRCATGKVLRGSVPSVTYQVVHDAVVESMA